MPHTLAGEAREFIPCASCDAPGCGWMVRLPPEIIARYGHLPADEVRCRLRCSA